MQNWKLGTMVACCLLAHSAWAQNDNAAQGLRADTTSEGDIRWLESTRTWFQDTTEWIASGIDGWFGDKPFEASGGRVYNGRVGFRGLYRQDEGFDMNVRFSVRMELPNARDRAYLIIGRDNEREMVSDQSREFSRAQQLLPEDRNKDDSFFAGFGVTLNDNFDTRIGIRGGYKVYAQARYRYHWVLSEKDEIRFRETFFWTVSDGFGATTKLDYEHVLDHDLTFRWLNYVTVSESTDGAEWGSSVGYVKRFSGQRELSGEVIVNGETGGGVGVKEYGVRATWEQPIYKDWLIGEVIVGHYWPHHEGRPDREQAWALGLGVEMRF